ncbi:MAG: Crp/Fnr family transcriptional regulator [Anaerolineae bacterium]|nr:Crp/Fnr family transcriptional regulator [Thermoflexales bacterium]MDW8407222.1 Crp/Fnr family transcriptional regulator [Anaerolineae bacterium]
MLDHLSHIPLLSGAPAPVLDDLARESRLRNLARGEILFTQGDPALAVHFVLSGRVRLIQHTTSGQDVTIGVFALHEPVGLLVALEEATYPGTCEALDQSTVISISAAAIVRAMTQYPPFMLKVIKILHARLMEANDRIRELSAERVERRLARAVLRLANKVGVKEETHGVSRIRIDMPLSRQSLAELTGTTLHTVSRILSDWQRAGLIDAGREQLVIVRPHELVLIAEELTQP